MAGALIVYYSLEGNTDYIAKAIAEETGAALFRLQVEEDISAKGLMRYFHGGRQSVTKSAPSLVGALPDLVPYGVIFLGTPVWASTYVPALRSFFQGVDLSGKKVAGFACYRGNPGRTEKELQEACPSANFQGFISFKDPLKNQDQQALAQAKTWASGIIAATKGV